MKIAQHAEIEAEQARVALHQYECLVECAITDCTRALRTCANAMERAALAADRGTPPNTSSHRSDMREVELALLAYDKARAACAAVHGLVPKS